MLGGEWQDVKWELLVSGKKLMSDLFNYIKVTQELMSYIMGQIRMLILNNTI